MGVNCTLLALLPLSEPCSFSYWAVINDHELEEKAHAHICTLPEHLGNGKAAVVNASYLYCHAPLSLLAT